MRRIDVYQLFYVCKQFAMILLLAIRSHIHDRNAFETKSV